MNVQNPSRQEILAEFRRRRSWAFLALVPFLAGFGLLVKSGDLDFSLAGLRAEQLMFAGFALIGVSMAAYMVVWRCPVCKAGFSRGLSVPLCPKCGTVFSEPSGEPTADPEGASREHLERALASEIKKYRSERSPILSKGVVLMFLGLVAAIFLPLGTDSMPRDGWAYRTFGDQASLIVGVAFGGLFILIGLLIVVFQSRSINAGARRHEKQLREKMGLPPSS
jgi:rubredoxin